MQQGQATFPSIPACLQNPQLAGHHGPACNNQNLLPRFHLRCDEANVIHTRLVADVEHVCHC
jgi:hypothetical protein